MWVAEEKTPRRQQDPLLAWDCLAPQRDPDLVGISRRHPILLAWLLLKQRTRPSCISHQLLYYICRRRRRRRRKRETWRQIPACSAPSCSFYPLLDPIRPVAKGSPDPSQTGTHGRWKPPINVSCPNWCLPFLGGQPLLTLSQ